MTGVRGWWPDRLPVGYQVHHLDVSPGRDIRRVVYADHSATRWLCADARYLYPQEPWHAPSWGTETVLADGPGWLITDPAKTSGLTFDHPSPCSRMTWRRGDEVVDLHFSTTIDRHDAVTIANHVRRDGLRLTFGWVPDGLDRVDGPSTPDEAPQTSVTLRRERLDRPADQFITITISRSDPRLPISTHTATGCVTLSNGTEAFTTTFTRRGYLLTVQAATVVWWRPGPDVLIEITGRDVDVDEIVEVANGLHRIDQRTWEQHSARHEERRSLEPDDGTFDDEWEDGLHRPWQPHRPAETDRSGGIVVREGTLDGADWQLQMIRWRPTRRRMHIDGIAGRARVALTDGVRPRGPAETGAYLYLTYTPGLASPLVRVGPERRHLPSPFVSVRPLHLRRPFVVALVDEPTELTAQFEPGGTVTGISATEVPGTTLRVAVIGVPAHSTLTAITATSGRRSTRLQVLVPAAPGPWRAGNRSGCHVPAW